MVFKADKEYCLTADGKLCEPDDKAAATVLVHKGGTIPMATAVKYGLVAHTEPPADDEKPKSAKPSKKNLDLRRSGGKARLKHHKGPPESG